MCHDLLVFALVLAGEHFSANGALKWSLTSVQTLVSNDMLIKKREKLLHAENQQSKFSMMQCNRIRILICRSDVS